MDERRFGGRTPCRGRLTLFFMALGIVAIGPASGTGQDTRTPARATGIAGSGSMHDAGAARTQRHAAPNPRVYSVINLGPDNLDAILNERGQAAFSSSLLSSSSFFDGERTYGLGSLDTAQIRALNNRGTVIGQTYDDAEPISNSRAFTWTRAGGMRLLPGLGGVAFDINDRNQVVGRGPEASTTGRAVRWDQDGRIRPLGPLPPSQSAAHSINNRGLAGGFADLTVNGTVQAVLWDAAGSQTDLGPLGGTYASVDFVNERGEGAGQAFGTENEPARGFFWSAAAGMVPLNAPGPGSLYLSDLNDQGNIAGVVLDRGQPAEQRAAYRWSLAGGLAWLAPGSGPVTGLPERGTVGQEVRASVGFVDNAPGQTHGAFVRWSDGCASPNPLVRESGGVGTVSFRHRFCAPGLFDVRVRVRDSGGRSTGVATWYIVEDPAQPAVSGQGALTRGYGEPQALRFALWAPLGRSQGAASGTAVGGGPAFRLTGPFHYQSEQVDVTVRSGSQVRVEGRGRYNGRAGHRFLLEASGGVTQGKANGDRLRVRISHTGASGVEVVDYDNGAPSAAALASMPADRTLVEEGRISVGI